MIKEKKEKSSKQQSLFNKKHVFPNSYNSNYYHQQPNIFLTIYDEIKRNEIISNEELWNLKTSKEKHKILNSYEYHQTNNDKSSKFVFEKLKVKEMNIDYDYDSEFSVEMDMNMDISESEYLDILCDWSLESLFNHTIHTLYTLKARNYMESYSCPTIVHLGWRSGRYVPFMFGNHCEPWISRDAIYILSKILNKEMTLIEYGSGTSTIWLSTFVGFVVSSEDHPQWISNIKNSSQYLNINNIKFIQNNLGLRYVELDITEEIPIFDYINNKYLIDTPIKTDKNIALNMKKYDWRKGKISVFFIDGRLRRPSFQYAIDWIKSHGGIIIFDNSDRTNVGDDGEPSLEIVPKHWLRFDSSHWKQHTSILKDKKWLKNSRTTIYITRDKRCIQRKQQHQ